MKRIGEVISSYTKGQGGEQEATHTMETEDHTSYPWQPMPVTVSETKYCNGTKIVISKKSA